jgi:hypothetical protein
MIAPITLIQTKHHILGYDWMKIHDLGYNSKGELKTVILETPFGLEARDYDEEFSQDVLPYYKVTDMEKLSPNQLKKLIKKENK